jgi:CRISPR-associated endonuclease/helicase Cas3
VTLTRSDFAAFFAALHDGHRPFAWQERLLDAVLEDGRWPENLVAPTGSGKTAVIDVHVFATALTAGRGRPVPPRRLALVVDRRGLVDDQLRYARALARRLADPAGGGNDVLAAVSARLRPLRWPDPHHTPGEGVSPLIVARLRGGAPPSREWREHPTAAAVICATPDMWGSRLLLRGYGSPARVWPREAALLAIDSVVVVDEAHLAQQLLCTARRIAELIPVAERNITPRQLQVAAATATPQDAVTARAIGVELDDLEDHVLGRRLSRPKPVRLQPVKGWARPAAAGTAALADAVVELVGTVEPVEGAAGTIGCFVNTVARAVGVAEELRRRAVDGRRLRVVMVCGHARPIDVELLEVHHPGLLSPRGNDDVDVLVSTQSLEVGADLDLEGMVTELAGGSALAQRAGRVNRRGLRPEGPVVVTVPEDDEFSDRLRSGPYNAEDLDAAMTWLRKRAFDSVGLAPWALRDAPPPMLESRRILLQRPELGDAWHLARTSDELAAEPELELWLSDDFAADTSVGVVVRELPADADDALQLLRALPPRRHEVFSIPTAAAREALHAVPQDHLHLALRVRGDDVTVLERLTGDGGAPPIRPGDVLVFDTSVPLFTRSDAAFSPPVLAPPGAERIPGGLAGADDVLEAQAELPEPVWAERRVGAVVHRVEFDAEAPHTDLLDPDGEPPDGDALRAAVLAVLGTGPMATAAAELLTGPARHSDVVVHRDAEGRAVRALVIDRRRATADEDMRQVWPPAVGAVTLAAHQHAVAQRATLLAQALGLDDNIVEVLHAAGAHHDDGKADARFQRRQGTRAATVLAKSRAGTTPEQMRRNEAASGLPSGWRHEQLSVLAAWGPLAAGPDRELAARLVGTSHGLGRAGFPHTADELTPDAPEVAQWLFDHGGWDELIEATHHRYGVWGCAYLEAVLRAADGQISAEGR